MYYAYINDGMCSFCGGVDGFMGFAGGTTLAYIDSGIIGLMESARDKIMPSIMGGSIGAFKGFITFSGVFVIFFMALYFFMKDYDRMLEAEERHSMRRSSIFSIPEQERLYIHLSKHS